jgi:hypothetical protein
MRRPTVVLVLALMLVSIALAAPANACLSNLCDELCRRGIVC